MKVLVIRANPRKNGYTQKLTDLFSEGIKQGNADLTEIDITKKKINQCQGCYTYIEKSIRLEDTPDKDSAAISPTIYPIFFGNCYWKRIERNQFQSTGNQQCIEKTEKNESTSELIVQMICGR